MENVFYVLKFFTYALLLPIFAAYIYFTIRDGTFNNDFYRAFMCFLSLG